MPQKCVQVKDRVKIDPNEKKDCQKIPINCGDIAKTPKNDRKIPFSTEICSDNTNFRAKKRQNGF